MDVSNAQLIGDLGRAVIQGDADLRVCNVKKDAVVAIADAKEKPWWKVWK